MIGHFVTAERNVLYFQFQESMNIMDSKVSAKLCLNLAFLKWLKPKRTLSTNLTRSGSEIPYVSFRRGLIKAKSFLQNIAWEIKSNRQNDIDLKTRL